MFNSYALYMHSCIIYTTLNIVHLRFFRELRLMTFPDQKWISAISMTYVIFHDFPQWEETRFNIIFKASTCTADFSSKTKLCKVMEQIVQPYVFLSSTTVKLVLDFCIGTNAWGSYATMFCVLFTSRIFHNPPMWMPNIKINADEKQHGTKIILCIS
jgi:hypothetical protein